MNYNYHQQTKTNKKVKLISNKKMYEILNTINKECIKDIIINSEIISEITDNESIKHFADKIKLYAKAITL